MPKPVPVSSFPEGDDDNYPWSTRVSKGEHQFLLDIMSDFSFVNKAATLRYVVAFAFTYMPQILAEQGESFSERVSAEIEFMKSEAAADRYEQILCDLNARLSRIAAMDNPTVKAGLEASAKRHAEANGIPWPPPETPLIAYDTEAKYVLDRIHKLISESQEGNVTLRDLNMRTTLNKDALLPVLERLEKNEYIKMRNETRSGPPTVVIEVPTITFSSIDVE